MMAHARMRGPVSAREMEPHAMSTDLPHTIPAEVLARPIRGLNLSDTTLGEALGGGPTLVVFLRHFG